VKFESLRITSAIIILMRTYAYAPWVSLLSPVVLAVGSNHSVWHPSVLASDTITQTAKITKSAERSRHDWTNLIHRTAALGAHYNVGPAKILEYSFMNRSTKITAMISVNFLLISVA
jgi:hypothetical protein